MHSICVDVRLEKSLEAKLMFSLSLVHVVVVCWCACVVAVVCLVCLCVCVLVHVVVVWSACSSRTSYMASKSLQKLEG